MNKQRILFRTALYLFASIVTYNSLAQDKALGTVKIASPNAASLGKFVDIPVNYYSGVPNIGVPVYTIKSGTLEMPISLSYHASGIKLQEQASWVGTGWALNAGGVITRTVRGAPDEKQTNSLNQKYGYFTDSGFLSYMFKLDDGSPKDYHNDPISGVEFYTGKYDGEPDLFFFNFGGYSGKFYFNDDRTPVIVPEQDIKIEYKYTPGLWTGGPGPYVNLGRCIEGFIITTPDGVKYYFGMAGSTATSPYVDPIEVTSPFTLNNGATFSRSISSWYLNKIVSPDGQFNIDFKYQKDSYAYYNATASNPLSGTFSGENNTYDLVKNLVDGVKLSQISYANGKVDFLSGPVREDLCNWAGGILTINDEANQNSTSLGAIQISDNNSGGFCKKFAFTYGYFTDNTTPLPAYLSGMNMVSDKKRLRLDYIQELNCDGTVSIPPYHFEYFTEPVPRTISFGMDHWGFINGASNSDLLPSLTKNYTPYITTSVNRNASWPAMRGGTLNKITFPTGGATTYDFEANSFTVMGTDQTVGGLRIKIITQSDAIDAQRNIVTSFSYLDSTGKSSAILYSKPVYIQKIRNDIHAKTQQWISTSPEGCFPTTAPIFSRNTIRPMETTQGGHIGYSEIKVSKTNNGYSVYKYYGMNPLEIDHTNLAITNLNDNGLCSLSIPNHPAAPLPNDFKRGNLKYEGHYNQSGQILNEKQYYYTYQDNAVVVPGYIYTSFQNGPNTAVLMTFYELKTGRQTETIVTEKNYVPGTGVLETQTETLFESPYHHQPTKTITTNSTGQTIEKRIKYSSEYIPASVSGINCNYQNYTYTNTVNSFPTSYQYLLDNCGPESLSRSVCIGNIWYDYMKAISVARRNYIICRGVNYINPGNTYYTAHNNAKTNADALLKPILWLQDNNMIVPIEITSWKNNQLIDAVYNQYSNNRDDSLGIYMYKTQKIDLASLSSTFTTSTVATENLSIIKDSRYTDLATYDFNKGNIINVLSRDAVPNSYEWGYNQNLPVVKVINASNKYKESTQPSLVNKTFYFQLGPNNPTSGTLQAVFTQTQSGPITIDIPSIPPGAQAICNFTLTGPVNQTGYLCSTGSGGASCGTTPSSITYSNMLPGQYTLNATVNSSFSSYTFNYSLCYYYQGMAILQSGLKEFFYDSFEENASATIGTAHTGTKYWNTNYTVSFIPPNSRNYIIQWWNLVNGVWNINQQAYTTNMILTGPVDDIRIFPSDAQMNTYTYDPLKGMTSQWDLNNKVFYYEYDALGRLKLVKDQDKNILKRIDYNYAGQVSTTYSNVIKSGTFTRNNCASGYTGSSVTYTVPAGTYTSVISQADADQLAQNDVNANGQAYANTNGTCTASVTISGTKSFSCSGTKTGSGIITAPPGYLTTVTMNAGGSSGSYTISVTISGGVSMTRSVTNGSTSFTFTMPASGSVNWSGTLTCPNTTGNGAVNAL
jgi:Family of unknown function (DUF5977)